MKYFFITILLLFLFSCTPHYDYSSLSYMRKGAHKNLILQDFNIDVDDVFKYSKDSLTYEVYLQKYFVVSDNSIYGGGTYDYFIFIFKDNLLANCGTLEDLRRSEGELDRRIAKYITEEL